MKDVFDSFSIGDFVFQSENMTYSEFLAFCKSVLDEIEKLNLSDNGFYKEKKNSIVKLYRFAKSAEAYVRTNGATAGGNSETDLVYLKAILDGIKKTSQSLMGCTKSFRLAFIFLMAASLLSISSSCSNPLSALHSSKSATSAISISS